MLLYSTDNGNGGGICIQQYDVVQQQEQCSVALLPTFQDEATGRALPCCRSRSSSCLEAQQLHYQRGIIDGVCISVTSYYTAALLLYEHPKRQTGEPIITPLLSPTFTSTAVQNSSVRKGPCTAVPLACLDGGNKIHAMLKLVFSSCISHL